MTTETDPYVPAAIAAADWWTERVTGYVLHKAIDFTNHDQPDQDVLYGLVTAGLMGRIADRFPVDEDTAQHFRALLIAKVANALGRQAEVRPEYVRLHIMCDYGPDLFLAEVAKEAGVHESRFPIKTSMAIQPDYVTVSEGYGAPHLLLWGADGWTRPTCDELDYIERDGHFIRLPRRCSKPRWHPGDGDRVHRYDNPTPLCRHCNWEEGYFGHHGIHDTGWLAHDFEPGAFEICAVCRRDRLMLERAAAEKDRDPQWYERFICKRLDPTKASEFHPHGTWVPTGHDHEWTTVAESALEVTA